MPRFGFRKKSNTTSPAASENAAQRLNALHRRRQDLLYEVSQGQLARQPENPWRDRVALLNSTISEIRRERMNLAAISPVLRPPLEPAPVAIDRVIWDDPAEIEFSVGDELFRFTSEADWAERGGAIVAGELEMTEGDPAALAATSWAVEDFAAFTDRLAQSLVVFANDLRRRAETEQPMPGHLSLLDLLPTCPACGDWCIWGGFCPNEQQRDQRIRLLDGEINARLDEIHAIEEQRARLADRLSVALKLLHDTDAEIAALQR